jgi:hypothetical protein
MGLDLKFFPIENPDFGGNWYVRTVLELRRDYRVFDLVRSVKCHLVGPLKKVFVPGDRECPACTEDAYGSPLTFAMAGDLASVNLPDDAAYWTQAAWAYLRSLPMDTVVVLWWN